MSVWQNRLLPSFGAALALAVLWLTTSSFQHRLFGSDGDLGRHIRLGEWMIEHRTIPDVDHFSHTMRGQPFVPYEWLAEIAFAAAHRALGLAGAALLTGLLAALACWLVYRAAVGLGAGSILSVSAAAYAFVLIVVHLLPRPHMFTVALSAAFFALLVEHRRTGRARCAWMLAPLMLLWANLHGGFLAGFVLAAAFLADAARARAGGRAQTLALATGAALLASFANPAGPGIWAHCIGYLRNEFLVTVTNEYNSPDFHVLDFKYFLAGLALVLGLAMSGRVRIAFLEASLALFWVAASLFSARNIPLFAVVVVPLLARWAREALSGVTRFRAWEGRVWEIDSVCTRPFAAAVLVLAVVGWTVAHRSDPSFSFSERAFPVKAVEKARTLGLQGNVFNDFEWGGYLLYAAPEIPVFIDGQTDFYGEALTRDYLAAVQLQPGWRDVLERHRIGWTLTATSAPLNRTLELSPEWRLAYRDETATIFVRR